MQDPPDTASLLPQWIGVGLVGAFVIAGIYGVVRSAYTGRGWVKGAKFGFTVWLVQLVTMAGWSGVFNLRDRQTDTAVDPTPPARRQRRGD